MSSPTTEDIHKDPQLERSFLAALSRVDDPADLYHELEPTEELFTEHAHDFKGRRDAIKAEEEPPAAPDDWTAAQNPAAALERLRDLWQRRRLARAEDDLLARLNNEDVPPEETAREFAERFTEIESALQPDGAGTLKYPGDLVPDVLADTKEAREDFQAGGDGITGVKSGITGLDELLGGFQPGLTILSGGPGTGKTTFALQVAADAAARGTPALFVTFENSPSQLTLKGICAAGGMDTDDVRRGRVPMDEVRSAATRWREKAERLAIVEGHGELTRAKIRTRGKRLMADSSAERCLVVVDYLQFYAKVADDLSGMDTRAKVEKMGNKLRNEVGKRLRSPVLAISSQSRSGYNGDGEAKVRLDTLKESGDLEYTADAVAFLTPPRKDESRQATDPARAIDLTVAKNRHGRKHEGRDAVELIFRPDRGQFRPEAPQGSPGGDGMPQADSAVF